MKGDNWYHLVFTYDGSRDRAGLAIYVNGKFIPTQGTGEDLEPLESSVENDSPMHLGNDKESYFDQGAIADFRILNRDLDEQDAELLARWTTIANAREKDTAGLTAAERAAFLVYYCRISVTARARENVGPTCARRMPNGARLRGAEQSLW